MAGYVIVGALAAFGLFCVLWTLFGWLLPVCREGWLICPGKAGEVSFVPVYLWLRGMGLVKCPMIVADLGLGEMEKVRLAEQGIEICSLEELSGRLGIGAEGN